MNQTYFELTLWNHLQVVGASWEAFFSLAADQTVISEGYFYHKVNTDEWSEVLNMYVGYLDVGGVLALQLASAEPGRDIAIPPRTDKKDSGAPITYYPVV